MLVAALQQTYFVLNSGCLDIYQRLVFLHQADVGEKRLTNTNSATSHLAAKSLIQQKRKKKEQTQYSLPKC